MGLKGYKREFLQHFKQTFSPTLNVITRGGKLMFFKPQEYILQEKREERGW